MDIAHVFQLLFLQFGGVFFQFMRSIVSNFSSFTFLQFFQFHFLVDIFFLFASPLSTIFFPTLPHFLQGFPHQPFLSRPTLPALSLEQLKVTRLKHHLPRGPGICQLQDALEKMSSYNLAVSLP